jgi:hypothetical protein
MDSEYFGTKESKNENLSSAIPGLDYRIDNQ